jgi:dipeptidyl aminopeptidase/acylaminoacyl peptidase
MSITSRFAAIFLLLAPAAFAARWTPDDVLFAERAAQFDIAPDARSAVWVKSQMDKEKGTLVGNLFLSGLTEKWEVQLTRGSDNHSSPKFSPDGKLIAFLSSRRPQVAAGAAPPEPAAKGEQTQVWLIDARGGEPWPLTRFEKGVSGLAWMDAGHLLLAAAEDPSLYEQEMKRNKDTSTVVEDESHAAPVRLFRFDIKTKTATRLSTNPDRISSFAVSRDGAWAVAVHSRSLRYVYDQKVKPVTFLYDLRQGTSRQLFSDGKLLPAAFDWDPESRGFYFSAPFSSHPVYHHASISLLYYYDLAARSASAIPLDWPNGLSFGFASAPDGFLAALANGVRPRLARYTRSGAKWSRAWVEGEHSSNVFGFAVSRDGRTMVYRHTTASKPEQWYAATIDGATITASRPVTDLNSGFAGKPLARAEPVRWKGARNEEVEGILYYPHEYVAGRRYPLVVMIHGGPAAADFDQFADSWAYPHNLMAQRGAFVLKPNYHGSGQYGLPWVESIGGGRYNELEWIDVETGVDSLIARGLVDPAKLGVMGWSNGSIITIELTTRTARYKAASAGAGDVNWISDWANCEFGHSFDDYYLGKTPLDDPQLYIRKSPLFRMGKVTTPTIIFFGSEDRQVPTEQGWQHFRALQQWGRTDVRFILFPGEAHSPRKLAHQRRKLEEELAWFDKYLFGTARDAGEALKPGSPLAAALKLQTAPRIPEVVQRGDIAIGRFEVTREQYAAFDASYHFPPGTGNYPASGISFENAKRYCEWLSRTTGKKYRLGTEAEMEKLFGGARGGNTLDYWAGYPLNPDDAARLAPRIDSLGPGALLRPAGSFPGAGEDPVFDLDGNVAEWTVTPEGTGKPLGASADRPADAKSTAPPGPAYIGFRVVLE